MRGTQKPPSTRVSPVLGAQINAAASTGLYSDTFVQQRLSSPSCVPGLVPNAEDAMEKKQRGPATWGLPVCWAGGRVACTLGV